MDHVLAVESSSRSGSICLANPSGVVFLATCDRDRSHTEWVTMELEKQLSHHGFPLSKVDALAVTTGPGSFTGIRVAVNLVRSLAFCLDRPIVAASSLELIAHPHKHRRPRLWSVLPAFRDLLYVSCFEGDREVVGPMAQTKDTFLSQLTGQEALVLGSNLPQEYEEKLAARAILVEPPPQPLAQQLTQLYFVEKSRPRLKWWELKPLYVRASEAEEKLRRGLIRSPSEW